MADAKNGISYGIAAVHRLVRICFHSTGRQQLQRGDDGIFFCRPKSGDLHDAARKRADDNARNVHGAEYRRKQARPGENRRKAYRLDFGNHFNLHSDAVFIFAKPIVAAFGLGQEAVAYCSAHVRFVALCLPLFTSYFPLLGLFQGANNALFSTFVATGALTVRVVATYLFQGLPGVGFHMIWWNTIFGWGLGFVISWTHFLRRKWEVKQ